MASEVQQNYYGWQHGEVSEKEDFQGQPVSQMLDHGSISFGRFALEPLSWERRSVFTYNERQAELEKFKSPGLVAKKKAYFEEYYKKVRAMKSMQENQQTELSLDYGGDGSISSQTGDEDEPALPSPSLNEAPQSTSQASLEDFKLEINFENVCNEVSMHEDTKTRTLEQVIAKESIEPQDSHNVVKQEDDYNSSVQVHHMLSTGSSEVINENERNYYVKRTYGNDASPENPDLASLVYSTDPTSLSAVEIDFMPEEKPVHEKTKLTVSKPNGGPNSVPVSKEHVSTARHLSKFVCKSTSAMIKSSSLGSKHLLPNSMYRPEINFTSSKTSSSKARASDKCTSVVFDRSLTGLQKGGLAKGTKGPFLQSGNSGISNRLALRKLKPKGETQEQAVSEEKSTHFTSKSRVIQNKSRNHEELGKKLVESKYSSLHKNEIIGIQQQRSINLPSRNKLGLYGFISCNSGNSTFGDKAIKVNTTATKKSEGRSSKMATLPQSGSIKKQVTMPKNNDPSSDGRRSFTVGSSVHGKKSRQAMPIWR
ncbi:hypothetical protein HPP92_012686 [Vanilla planifolia]|uniref:Protein WVD2-like 7 n=1 Tax=Vanilla planifolia TaxID=51239 RepID=A0A835QT44_VANPL|nr:hypothetical protein HPP92_012686 [Vanilla planifolia]